ncbi:ArsR/SmtB family transcription factor [Teredinibacter turnerae]|uniref:ArsR/SmtB family transcription factor n=1 Tax=Teredinibacter turnerae TaxID=2426 RepID=UPI0003614612|nr:metalloregulator ArsR/SmtB family transcription factor [Teredinibacter turnerae]
MDTLELIKNSALADLANLLKSAGDELRLEILRALAQDSYGVLELSHIFDVRQNSISHHLKVLATANLVSNRREGNSIFYRRIHSLAGEQSTLRAALFQQIDELDLNPDVQARIDEIHQKRAQVSQLFFKEHGTSLREKQDLIAEFDVYGPQLDNFLNDCTLPNWERVLEVGPGSGELLPYLSARFHDVVALDNAETMLASARAHCQAKGVDNVHFELDDTHYCQQHPLSFDCVVINMVLHHTPSPRQIFADISGALKPGGVLIICDLCQHNQDWTQKACGDVWLGFEPRELQEWARAATMREGQSTYFALRNGFQIQIHEFVKI